MEPSPLLSSTSLSCLSFPPFPISPSQEGGHSFGRYNTRIPCCASHSMFQSFFFRAKLNHIQGEDGVYYVSYKMSSLPISDTCQFEQKNLIISVFSLPKSALKQVKKWEIHVLLFCESTAPPKLRGK